ncbi:MAG: DMT family transporter [Rhodobacterales bacterium]|nr:DMT family transporter [Rhodobacterales bacterium]
MLGFCITAPLIDVASKLAAATLPVGQITTARFVVQAVLMAPVCLWLGHGLRIGPGLAWALMARAACLIASTYCFVAAVAVMPIADALAIAFVEPFILLILGHYLFGDAVGPRRIAASVVGFGGALLVIQPSLVTFGLVALYPLGTALSFALYMLVTRSLSRRMHPVPMQYHTATVATLLCLPVMAAGAALELPTLGLRWPEGMAWLWLAGVGAASAGAHMLMTWALRFAPSATLAPLHYLEIVSAAALGYLVFDDFPDVLTWTGIGVIVASGLYIIHRERITAREGSVVAPPL